MQLAETLDKLCASCELSRERLINNITKAQGLAMRGILSDKLTPEQSATILRRLEMLKKL